MATQVGKTILLASDWHHSVFLYHAEQKSENLAYTAYGYRAASKDSLPSLGFNGQLIDRATGLYMLGNGYRAYNCTLCLFHSADSLSPFGPGGSNGRRYGNNDPINHIDPDGHVSFRTIASLVLATIRFIRPRSDRTNGLMIIGDYERTHNLSRTAVQPTSRTLDVNPQTLAPNRRNTAPNIMQPFVTASVAGARGPDPWSSRVPTNGRLEMGGASNSALPVARVEPMQRAVAPSTSRRHSTPSLPSSDFSEDSTPPGSDQSRTPSPDYPHHVNARIRQGNSRYSSRRDWY